MTTTPHRSPAPIRRRAFMGGLLLTPLVAGCGGAAPQKGASTPATNDWAAFDEYLTELANRGDFSGAVLVTQDGRPLLEAGYGMADRDAGEPNTPQTAFCIGSMNKMLTSVVIAQLVETGALTYEDTIGRHLTGFGPDVANTVTVHHLLTHTSGLGDIHREEPATEANRSIAAFMGHILRDPLQFAPGTRMSYSNAGYIVLGAIIERLTDRSYEDHVQQRVLAPAGMVDTDLHSYVPAAIPGMAHPYVLIDRDGRPVANGPDRSATIPHDAVLRDEGGELKDSTSAGGARSTVADMIGFARALIGHQLIGAALTETVLAGKVEMTPSVRGPAGSRPPGSTPSPAPPPEEQARYGYGFNDKRRSGVRIVGHNGGTPGYEAQLDIYPETGHAVVILTNQDLTLQRAMPRSEELLTS